VSLFRHAIPALIAVLSCACATNAKNVQQKSPLPQRQWETIAVMPFVNNKLLRRPASLWLSHKLNYQIEVSVLNDAQTELGLADAGFTISHEAVSKEYAAANPSVFYPEREHIDLENAAIDFDVTWFSAEELQRAGRLLGVDAVVGGYVLRYRTAAEWGSLVGLRLIDVQSGEIIVETQHGAGMTRSSRYDFHKDTALAVERSAQDLLALISRN
jgi:hypothetical protein